MRTRAAASRLTSVWDLRLTHAAGSASGPYRRFGRPALARAPARALRFCLPAPAAGRRRNRRPERHAERLPVALAADRHGALVADPHAGAGGVSRRRSPGRTAARRRRAGERQDLGALPRDRRGRARRGLGLRRGGVLSRRGRPPGVPVVHRGAGQRRRAADLLDAVVGLRHLRRRRDAAVQCRALLARHRVPAAAGRGGAAALRGERDHRLRARARIPRRLQPAHGLPAPVGRQCRDPGAARRAARQPARRAPRGAGRRPQAAAFLGARPDRGVRARSRMPPSST